MNPSSHTLQSANRAKVLRLWKIRNDFTLHHDEKATAAGRGNRFFGKCYLFSWD